MHLSRQTRNTLLFIALFLLGGVFRLINPRSHRTVMTLLFCVKYMIFAGLILSWAISVRDRLLPSRARTYMLAASLLMALYLLMRVFKYRIVVYGVLPSRYCAYAYWTPQMLIPALFWMTAIRIRRGETEKGKWNEALLLIPACAVSIMALTNDLHGFVYQPKIALSAFVLETGTYSLNTGFYLLYAWMIVSMVAGLFVLLRETKRKAAPVLFPMLGVTALWYASVTITITVLEPLDTLRMYNVPELHIFGMMALLEISIRNRLIPYNTNYPGFFAELGLPVLITDRSLLPVYETDRPVCATKEEKLASLREPVCISEDTRLFGMEIHAGYAFWTEDETGLNRENRRLESANDLLSEENDLIAAESRLKEQKAHLEAQNRVYDRIALALYPRQKQIEKLLLHAEPETEAFSQALGQACVLNAWSKRKSNLLLLNEDTLPRKNRELFLALQESSRFLKCCGIEAAAVGEEYAEFPLKDIHELYDTFEEAVEAYLPYMKKMTVSLTADGVRLAMEARQNPPLSTSILQVERTMSEGLVFLTIRRGKAGDRS